MKDGMENSIPRVNEKPPRPKKLQELYELLVTLYPVSAHNEESFFQFLITQLNKDGIRNAALKYQVEDERFNLVIPDHCPINDFLYAARDYLKSLNVSEEEIRKLWDTARDF